MSNIVLPDWNEADKKKTEDRTPLEQFIVSWEPAGVTDKLFRDDLLGLINHILESTEADAQKLQKALDFHPRASKLMRMRKPFIVISVTEPYFEEAFDLIRHQERWQGTWTEKDEEWYNWAIQENKAALGIGDGNEKEQGDDESHYT